MLFDGPEHIRIFGNHLSSSCNVAIVKLVPFGTETAAHRQIIQVVVDCLAVFFYTKLHIALFDWVFLQLLAVILRQLVKVVVDVDDEKEVREYQASELKFKSRQKKVKISDEEMKALKELEKDK